MNTRSVKWIVAVQCMGDIEPVICNGYLAYPRDGIGWGRKWRDGQKGLGVSETAPKIGQEQ